MATPVPQKLSHKQFRAMIKKLRRKKKRQQIAQVREEQELLEQKKRENSPNYRERQEEIRRNSELYEQFQERERQRKHKLWLLREQNAQIEFKRKKESVELENIRREEERKRILAEFEANQFELKTALQENEKIRSQKEEVLQKTLSELSGSEGAWHNPIAPQNYHPGIERDQCMFYAKTGCCRFGDRCSRGHIRPATSDTLLIRGMYYHFSIGQTDRDDYDTDIALEFDDKETYKDFRNFYHDVLPEFRKYGDVIQFKVCSNHEPHLRGNVYVQYETSDEAVEAYKHFNGRYYAGRQITCEFTTVIRWKSAICGLDSRNMCPKGINCNFLHVFKNPNNEFWIADRDFQPPPSRRFQQTSRRDQDTYRRRDYSNESSERHSRSSSHRSNRHHSPDDYQSSRHRKRRSRSLTPPSNSEIRESSSSKKHKKKKSKKKSKNSWSGDEDES